MSRYTMEHVDSSQCGVRELHVYYPVPEPVYVQVNIGRNEGGTPMSDVRWAWFVDTVRDAIVSSVIKALPGPNYTGVRAVTLKEVQIHRGLGHWRGNMEDSAHISYMGELDVAYLRSQLAPIARMFGQDTIALIVGSELVTA